MVKAMVCLFFLCKHFDCDILLQRLSISFGLSGNSLDWLAAFLQDRSIVVVHGSTRSLWVPAPVGLLQGSVLARDVPDIHPVPSKCRVSHYSVLPGPGKIMGPSNKKKKKIF